jgi:hypothetical protein
VLSVAVYLPLVAWLSYWFSLQIRSQARAIVMSVLTLLTTTFVPVVFGGERSISPASVVILNEMREVSLRHVVVNFAAYGALVFSLRWLCLRNADKYLSRCGGDVPVSLASIADGIRRLWPSQSAERVTTEHLTEGTGP